MSSFLIKRFVPVLGFPRDEVFKVLLFVAAGASIGFFSWGPGGSLFVLLLLPICFGFTRGRVKAFSLVLAYYLASARGLPEGTAIFFGTSAPCWYGAVFWCVSSLILTLPYCVLWSFSPLRRAVGFALAVVVVSLPPIGLIGWCGPLTIAGELFPSMAWFGIPLTLTLLGILAGGFRSYYAPGCILLVAVAANAISHNATAPEGWLSVDTSFPALHSGVRNGDVDFAGQIDAFRRTAWLNQLMLEVGEHKTIVLPETLIGAFTPMTESSLYAGEQALLARDSIIIVGTEIPQSDGRYINAMLVMDGTSRARVVLEQSIPVPVSMWRPFTSTGAIADITGKHGVMPIGTERVGVLICYEQLLPWVIFTRALRSPSVVLAVSNVWWAKETSIPAIQKQSVEAYARLFAWPALTAVNQ